MDHSAEHNPAEHKPRTSPVVTPPEQTGPGHAPPLSATEVDTNLDRPPLLSWGAVLAGLAVVLAGCSLMHLLGLALGVSIADATDGDAVTQGLGIGAIVWMLISLAIAYFVGSLMAARLSGKTDDTVGMLHGLTVWSTATMLLLVLSYMGVAGLLHTSYKLLSGTASTVAQATSGVVGGITTTGETMMQATETQLADNIQARLKRRAATILARNQAGSAPEVDVQEVRNAIDSMDAATLSEIASLIATGEMTAAREQLASATQLNQREVRDLIQGIENEFEEQLGTADNQTGLVGDISTMIERRTAELIADLEAEGGTEVTQQDIREALQQLSPSVLQTVSMRLMRGNADGAKDVLTANTNLTRRQINEIVSGVDQDISRTVERYQQRASKMIEATSDYTQAVLWTAFAAFAIALAVSLIGGSMGSETSHRLHMKVRSTNR